MKRKRARGEGFFAAADTQPYQPTGVVLGQETPDSCVAACCRMLLFDQLPAKRHDYLYAESHLRAALRTDEDGALVSLAPAVLREFGLTNEYVYRRDVTLEDLRRLAAKAPVIALAQAATTGRFHALLIDRINADEVLLRDPLPVGPGIAYRLKLVAFLTCWLNPETGCGLAVAVLE